MPSELPNIATAEASTMWEYYGLNQNARFHQAGRMWDYDSSAGKYTDSAVAANDMYTHGWGIFRNNMYDLDNAKEIGAGAPFGGYVPMIRGVGASADTNYEYARYKKVDQGYGRWKHEQAMQKLEREAEEARLVDRRKLANIRAKGLVLENTMKKKFSTALQQKQDVMDLDVADTGKHIANTSGKFNKKKWSRIAKAAKVASTGTSRRPI